MIKLFQPASNLETAKHYSTKRTGIGVIRIQESEQESEFCSCIMQCIPCLKFFTDTIGLDSYKNDFYSLFLNKIITGGTFEVSIEVNGESYNVTDNTYGFMLDGNNCFAYRFNAKQIYDVFGFCEFRAFIINYNDTGTEIQRDSTPCLKVEKFTDRSANKTVRIETRQSGRLLHGKNYSDLTPIEVPGQFSRKLTFWTQQIRLPGSLKISGMIVENDRLVLNDDPRTSLQILDKMGVEYDLTLERLSVDQAFPVIFDYLFSAPVYVTDYNVYNWTSYRNIRLIKTGVEFQPRIAKRNTFVIKMKREEENIEKFND